jgi:hypothetical protein
VVAKNAVEHKKATTTIFKWVARSAVTIEQFIAESPSQQVKRILPIAALDALQE